MTTTDPHSYVVYDERCGLNIANVKVTKTTVLKYIDGLRSAGFTEEFISAAKNDPKQMPLVRSALRTIGVKGQPDKSIDVMSIKGNMDLRIASRFKIAFSINISLSIMELIVAAISAENTEVMNVEIDTLDNDLFKYLLATVAGQSASIVKSVSSEFMSDFVYNVEKKQISEKSVSYLFKYEREIKGKKIIRSINLVYFDFDEIFLDSWLKVCGNNSM